MNVFVRIYGNSFAVFNRHYDRDEIFEKRKGCPIKGILSDHIRKNGQDFFSFESLTAERIPAVRQTKPIRA